MICQPRKAKKNAVRILDRCYVAVVVL